MAGRFGDFYSTTGLKMIEYMAANHWRSLNDSSMTQNCRRRMILERRELAVSCPSRCIKVNDSYREIPVSAPDPYQPIHSNI